LNVKIPLIIISSILIAFILLYVFNDLSRPLFDKSQTETEWYIQHANSDTKKIYLLGPSHVEYLNSTHIAKIISNEGKDFELYNLYKGAEFIEKRIPNLDNLISTKPTLVVIGIRYMDFSSYKNNPNFSFGPQPILDLFFNNQEKLELFREKSIPTIDLNNFKNPKLSTMKFISWIENKEKVELKQPLWERSTEFSEGWETVKINDMDGVEDFPYKNTRKFHGEIEEDGLGVLALKIMIEEFKKNDIDVVVYSTPHHDKFRDSMNTDDLQKFRTILEEISIEYEIPVEFLDERYSDLEIWENYDHIARNPKALIYSEDVAEIILKYYD